MMDCIREALSASECHISCHIRSLSLSNHRRFFRIHQKFLQAKTKPQGVLKYSKSAHQDDGLYKTSLMMDCINPITFIASLLCSRHQALIPPIPVEIRLARSVSVAAAIFLGAGIRHSAFLERLVCRIIFMNIKPPKKRANLISVNQLALRCSLWFLNPWFTPLNFFS